MSRRTLPPRTAPAPTTDELVDAVTTALARAGASGRVGVAYAGDVGSALLLDLAVRVVGRSRVVALVSTGPETTPERRCTVAQAANARGVATFDVLGGRIDDVARLLELSVVVVPDDRDGVVGRATVLDDRGGTPAPERSSTTEDPVQVEAAESELRRLGLDDLRVRHHGDLARLEAPRHDLVSVTSEPLRGEVVRAVRSAGFRLVALDLGASPDAGEA
ncbi:hypothetical protein IF650_04390 [Cellulosimicrobium terreum]|nr:hypothetical protein [Cellulosimicrobium terreum]